MDGAGRGRYDQDPTWVFLEQPGAQGGGGIIDRVGAVPRHVVQFFRDG